jgi:hypothetical protein
MLGKMHKRFMHDEWRQAHDVQVSVWVPPRCALRNLILVLCACMRGSAVGNSNPHGVVLTRCCWLALSCLSAGSRVP